ncbi:periplasmic sensor signal transduction histidine kinase [Pseudoalteromonas luteoviolacea B = ATCC 29581]|nr:periplasmic sensor signal transduction histidine kinase [Pseudoalteromonas luteoviolacea B = ATCC 29581]
MKLSRSLVFFKSAAIAGIVVISVGCALIYEQMAKNTELTRVMDQLQNSINSLIDQESEFINDRSLHSISEVTPLVAQYQFYQNALMQEIGHVPHLLEHLGKLDRQVNEYAQLYERLVSLQALIGFDQNSGRYGRFRDAAHAMQAHSEQLNDLYFTKLILELRRREKDYLLRFDPIYLELHSELISETNRYINAHKNALGSSLSLLESYKKNFDTYVDILKQQGTSPNEGLRSESKLAQHALRLQLSTLSELIIQHNQTDTESLIWWVLILMIVITAANYALLNHLNARVSKDILAINRVLFKVTQEENFNVRIAASGSDEIAQISTNIDELLGFIETLLSRLTAAQQRLIEEAKMAGLGNMVSGFAHELNTPLGVAITSHSHLKGRIENLKHDFAAGLLKKNVLSELLKDADEAMVLLENNLTKAANLIENFKQVAVNQQQDNESYFSLFNLVVNVLDCYQNELKEPDYHIELDIAENLYLKSYPSAFNQLLRYLLNNCIKHAKIPDKTLKITLSAMVVNDYLHFYLKDDGQGISKELLPVVFEPFVTSKRNQGGTGLGLSIAYNLVTQKLAGEIKVQSFTHGGVCFHIILPHTPFLFRKD